MALDPLGTAASSQNALPSMPPKTGFASQSAEHAELPLDLNDLIVNHVGGTFYFRVSGPPFDSIDIAQDDIVIVDRVERLADGCLVVAVDAGEFIIRWLVRREQGWYLVTDHEQDAAIPVAGAETVFGVVTHVIHAVGRKQR